MKIKTLEDRIHERATEVAGKAANQFVSDFTGSTQRQMIISDLKEVFEDSNYVRNHVQYSDLDSGFLNRAIGIVKARIYLRAYKAEAARLQDQLMEIADDLYASVSEVME